MSFSTIGGIEHVANNLDAKIVVYQTPFSITGPVVKHKGHIYRLAIKHDFLAFRNYADSLDGFKLQYNRKNEIIVWNKKVSGETMRMVKVFGVFPGVAPETLYDTLHDPLFREVWDTHRIDSFRIVKLNENNDIGYYAVKSTLHGVSSRDFVNQRAWLNAGNDEYVIFNTSVPHRDVPKGYLKAKGITEDNVVRAVSKIAGYLVRPWTDGRGVRGACLTYIAQCDLAGWIPASITNYFSTKLVPRTFKVFAQAVAQFPLWLAERSDHERDWVADPDSYGIPVHHMTIEYVKEKWEGNID